MASISLNFSGSPWGVDRTYTLSVVETSYNSVENTSLVTWTLTSSGSSTWYNYYLKAVVNGTQIFNASGEYSDAVFPAATGTKTGTMTVSHTSDGSKSIAFSIEGYAYAYTVASTSGTLTLTNIDRSAPTVTGEVQTATIDVNSMSVKATSSNYASQFAIRKKTTGDYGAWTYWTASNDTTTTHTFALTGLSTNTTYTFQVAAKRGLNGVWGYSTAVSGKTLGSSTITSASVTDGLLGNACNIQWTPLDSTFKFKLTFSLGDWSATVPSSGYITPNSTNAYTYTGYTIPLAVANQLPSSVNGKMAVSLTTYTSGGTQVGSPATSSFWVTIPSSVVPTISQDALTNVISGNKFSVYTKTLSSVKNEVIAQGAYGSSIIQMEMTVSGKTYTKTTFTHSGNDYSATLTSNALTKYGTLAVYTKVTDSRNRTYTHGQNITVYNYWKPSLSLAIDISGTTVTTTATWNIAPVNNQNTKALTIVRKKLSTSATTTHTATITNKGYSDSYTWTQTLSDINVETYEYTATITDKIQSTTVVKSTGQIALSLLGGGKGATFFGKAQNSGVWIVNNGTYVELDYIVDQGTSGIWTYRKWNSGVSECWGQVNVNVTSWSQFGNAYEGLSGAGVQTYPTSLFNAAPTLNYSITRNDGAPAIISIEASTGASSSQTPNLYPIRPSSSSTTGNNLYVMHYYAVGRWKS